MNQRKALQRKPAMSVFKSFYMNWLPSMTWGIAIAMMVFTVLLIKFNDYTKVNYKIDIQEPTSAPTQALSSAELAAMPDIGSTPVTASISREANPRTIIASQPRQEIVKYTVEKKDSIFGIGSKFKLQPETILWANYDLLEDNPDMLEPGAELNIPPVDGVYYEWQEGDTLESVAEEFGVSPEDIILYSPNKLDITNPVIELGTNIMIPGGKREMQQWVMPYVPVPGERSGVTTNVMGSGGCSISGGAYGGGTFIYPTREHRISGNDYWSGHLGIDLACGLGDPLAATDGGVIIYSGWAGGGYGNTIVIDHGTGYQTLYAHLTSVAVNCGASVNQGAVVGFCGSTGNSTGPHLHFEVRYLGGFINPWYVLQ